MARVHTIQTNFTAGELTPRLKGRVDIAKYFNAVEIMENWIPFFQGGVTRRKGKRFLNETKDSEASIDKKARLVPFEFSEIDSHIIEFGDLYIRFYQNGARIESPPSTPVEIASPYTEAQLSELQFAQSADVLFISHQEHQTRKLIRISATVWTLSVIDFFGGPLLSTNTVLTQTLVLTGGAPWIAGSTLTLTAVGFTPFLATSIGGVYLLIDAADATKFTFVRITAFTSTTVVTVVADVDVPTGLQGTLTSVWRPPAFSGLAKWPRSITFFEQRLCLAATALRIQTVFCSATGDFENFLDEIPGQPITDNLAIQFTVASPKQNAIRWLASTRVMVAGTLGGEYGISGANAGPLTPSSIDIKKHTYHGSSILVPVHVGQSIIYMQKQKTKLRDFQFDFGRDAYVAPDLTLLSEHITGDGGGIIAMDYEQEPDSIVWMVRNDGQLVGMTFLREQEVFAWHRQVTSGKSGDHKYESVAVIPADDGLTDETWVIVNRTIGGSTKRFVELFKPGTNTDSNLEFTFGSPTTVITGLSHLNGEVVDIIGDGIVLPQETVVAGSVTADRASTTFEVGLHYDSTITTLPPEAGNPAGTAQARQKRQSQIVARLFKSVNLLVNGQQLIFTKGGDLMDTAVPVFTGDKKISNLEWDTQGNITIVQNLPLNCTILALITTLSVGER